MGRIWALSERRLGRIPAMDTRDWRYPMRKATRRGGCLGGDVVVKVVGKTWPLGAILDQGNTSQCVAYAWAQWLQTEPLPTPVNTPAEEEYIYSRAQQIDEWEGESYDGTSVRAGAKVMAEEDHLDQYVWAATEQDIWDFVGTTGPVVVGTGWYTAMFSPNSAGYLLPAGVIEGGHAYLLYQTNPLSSSYGMANSWGDYWGRTGTALIHRADMARLLGEDGEACAGSEVPVA